jgi:hypothetical protein
MTSSIRFFSFTFFPFFFSLLSLFSFLLSLMFFFSSIDVRVLILITYKVSLDPIFVSRVPSSFRQVYRFSRYMSILKGYMCYIYAEAWHRILNFCPFSKGLRTRQQRKLFFSFPTRIQPFPLSSFLVIFVVPPPPSVDKITSIYD